MSTSTSYTQVASLNMLAKIEKKKFEKEGKRDGTGLEMKREDSCI